MRLRDRTAETKAEEPPKSEAKRLPDNFAEQVLDCELEIEKENVNIEVVQKLINLYQVKNKTKRLAFNIEFFTASNGIL